ncbi:cGMP-dependent protein kinase 2 [Echinococcus granulosus]|uniref:cGMP-dependent protein kinase 2 n=1 Tax=Echinococcus granulosus TaxID=6210 RepID=W6UW90_ECHGR|nr:cGMP-dependent protein kinase 2 [Echinococcus granulosus]EUB62717.1 cGMP-dependent protein kinase 2 [Echinococcus granulosus]
MASHNSFDNQALAVLDRHPQSPSSPPVDSSPNLLNATSSAHLFAQPVLPLNLRPSVDDYKTPPPVPPHQNTAASSTTATTTTTLATVLQPSYSAINSSDCILIDGQLQSVEGVQSLVAHLREEIALRNTQIARLTGEVESLRRIVGDRDRDVDQLKSVLDQKYIPMVAVNGTNHSSSSSSNNNVANTSAGVSAVEEGMEYGEGGVAPLHMMSSSQPTTMPPARIKKQGVCGESVSRNANIGFIHYEKDHNSRSLIYNAITSNDFLNNLEQSQIEEIVLCMYEKRVNKGCFIIREGEPGDALYVTAEGLLEVLKGNQVIGQMEVGRAFGEMALLYNCNRTASVKALTNAKFWTLDRRVYQQIMMNSSVHKHKENFQFLLSVSDFKNLSQRKLHKLADVLELIYYPGNEYIIRQGEVGETFFIIHSGQVKITQSKVPGEPPQDIRFLGAGDWFGERALYTRDKRSANVVAMPPGVHVLCLDRSNFIHLIGDLNEIKSREYGDSNQSLLSQSPATDVEDSFSSGEKRASMTSQLSTEESAVGGAGGSGVTNLSPFFSTVPHAPSKRGSSALAERDTGVGNARASATRENIKYEDLVPVAILGIGGFGRVELVVLRYDPTKSFALKCMKKKHIVDTRQEKHIFSERNLMFEIKSSFVCRLYATYRDAKYVYMLLEACLGGEIWTILRNRPLEGFVFVCGLKIEAVALSFRDDAVACYLPFSGNFDDNITRFIVASVLEAFTYLHTNHIIYRDLKPENLLLDGRGYIKLCDFGFAKKISPGKKTWTFCGTPEYVAPEIILNKGHDHSADYWSLGILMFELLTGSPPFTGMDPMKIYNIILRGIDAIMFPPFQINRTATALIHRLCAQNPVERLGYGRGGIVDIKQHKYFQGFDWIGLCRGTLQAPILPKISGPTDVSNFDHYPDITDVPPDELSGWDAEF